MEQGLDQKKHLRVHGCDLCRRIFGRFIVKCHTVFGAHSKCLQDRSINCLLQYLII